MTSLVEGASLSFFKKLGMLCCTLCYLKRASSVARVGYPIRRFSTTVQPRRVLFRSFRALTLLASFARIGRGRKVAVARRGAYSRRGSRLFRFRLLHPYFRLRRRRKLFLLRLKQRPQPAFVAPISAE